MQKAFLCLVLLSSNFVFASPINTSAASLLQYSELLEQTGISKTIFDQVLPLVDARFEFVRNNALEIIASELAAEGSFILSQPLRLKKRNFDSKSCTLVNALAALAIAETALLKNSATMPDDFSQQIKVSALQNPIFRSAFEEAAQKARWAFRYFLDLDEKTFLGLTSHCFDFTYPDKLVAGEMFLRLKFISHGAQMNGKTLFYRWPLGRAKAMCGRPFNTHYVDHLSSVDASRSVDRVYDRVMCLAHKNPEHFEESLKDLDQKVLGVRF